MNALGARVVVSESDHDYAAEALSNGIILCTLEKVLTTADIYITATGNKEDIIKVNQMAEMKNNAIVANIESFDNAIDMVGLENCPGIKKTEIHTYIDRYLFPDGHGIIILAQGRPLNLECATDRPSFVIECLLAYQALAHNDFAQLLALEAQDNPSLNALQEILP